MKQYVTNDVHFEYNLTGVRAQGIKTDLAWMPVHCATGIKLPLCIRIKIRSRQANYEPHIDTTTKGQIFGPAWF